MKMGKTKRLKHLKKKREATRHKIQANIGEILDTADLLLDCSENWLLFLQKQRPAPEEMMIYPQFSREFTLQRMAQEVIQTSSDLYENSRAGLARPVQMLIRKQLETRTNALFFALDASGEYSYRYQHWQLAAEYKLNPHNEIVKSSLAHSLDLLGDSLKDRTGRNWGNWAKLPNGKDYSGFVNRFNYVAKNISEFWSNEEFSGYAWGEITQHDLEMYRNANTVVHPSMISHLHLTDFLMISTSNNLYFVNVLHAYRESVLPNLSLEALLLEDIYWCQLADAYSDLSANVVSMTETGRGGLISDGRRQRWCQRVVETGRKVLRLMFTTVGAEILRTTVR